jgi:hypothetical protein
MWASKLSCAFGVVCVCVCVYVYVYMHALAEFSDVGLKIELWFVCVYVYMCMYICML